MELNIQMKLSHKVPHWFDKSKDGQLIMTDVGHKVLHLLIKHSSSGTEMTIKKDD